MGNGICKTIKIESSDAKTQGDYLLINKEDYNADVHKLYVGDVKPPTAVKPLVTTVKFSKEAEKLALEAGLNIDDIVGGGRGGNIRVADVTAAIEAAKPSVDFASDEAGELAVELGFDAQSLTEIKGTGDNGAITVADIEKFVDGEGE